MTMHQAIAKFEADIWADKAASFNDKYARAKEVQAWRDAANKIRWNANQFQRRSDFVRKTGVSEAVAESMFPVVR